MLAKFEMPLHSIGYTFQELTNGPVLKLRQEGTLNLITQMDDLGRQDFGVRALPNPHDHNLLKIGAQHRAPRKDSFPRRELTL